MMKCQIGGKTWPRSRKVFRPISSDKGGFIVPAAIPPHVRSTLTRLIALIVPDDERVPALVIVREAEREGQ